jgi:hypothetical protein
MEAELHTWRRARPAATWTEIEQAVDRQLDRLRAQVLGEVVADTAVPPTCPTCGGPLQARGEHARTVITDGGEPITLTRSYQTCPACGTGLFPP